MGVVKYVRSVSEPDAIYRAMRQEWSNNWTLKRIGWLGIFDGSGDNWRVKDEVLNRDYREIENGHVFTNVYRDARPLIRDIARYYTEGFDYEATIAHIDDVDIVYNDVSHRWQIIIANSHIYHVYETPIRNVANACLADWITFVRLAIRSAE